MKKRALVNAVLWIASLAGAATISAQMSQQVYPAGQEARVASGDDVGFRIEGHGPDGQARGRFVVKVDGEWREIELIPRIKTVR